MTDGTKDGTRIVAEINSATGSDPQHLTNVNGTLFLTADDGFRGRELWRSDGTEDGTDQVADINLEGSSDPHSLTVANGTLFFSANDGLTTDGRTSNFELWKSDGTLLGTDLVKDIDPGTGATPTDRGSEPQELVEFQGKLFFSADDGGVHDGDFHVTGRELWGSDGTEGGTVLFKDIFGDSQFGSFPRQLTPVDERMFFVADGGSQRDPADPMGRSRPRGRELWVTDGTAGNTRLVKDIASNSSSSEPQNLTALGELLVFTAFLSGDSGRELWKSDGTVDGTVLLKDIFPGAMSSFPIELTVLGDQVLFAAGNNDHGRELWKTNGTEAGTELVKNIAPAGSSNPTGLAVFGDEVFFSASESPEKGAELWRSNGISEGTKLETEINTEVFGSSSPEFITELGGQLIFVAQDAEAEGEAGSFVLGRAEHAGPVAERSDLKMPDPISGFYLNMRVGYWIARTGGPSPRRTDLEQYSRALDDLLKHGETLLGLDDLSSDRELSA